VRQLIPTIGYISTVKSLAIKEQTMNATGDSQTTNSGQRYKVVIKGKLDKKWEEWFEGATVAVESGDTILTGFASDQTELHGLFRKIHDLHLTLKSLETF
jgi:hypothetical protein